ncbi:MAG TPA: ComEC/Rec2 family competence protein [Bryobacteraceae bacterium]|nr:ComEC/Rec2 family competence protein [Bryobacteraceae bacterium]
MRDPLLPPLAAIATGILVSRLVSFNIRELLIVIAGFAVLGTMALWRKARVLAGACCLLGFLFAGALTDLAHRPAPRPELDAEGREPVILSGCVVQPPALSGDRERFVMELEPGARVQVTAYAREGQPPPALRYGQRVEFEARVRRPRNFGNPGSFDYARYLARRDIYWTAATSTGAPVTVLPGVCGSRFAAAVMRLRVMALDRLAQLYSGKPYETGMMQAVMIGETYQVQRVWTEQFRNTGTFHALVISGTHTAALAAFLMLILRLCFLRREATLLITSGLLWLYALVTGWGSPCVRCAAGFTLFAIATYFARQRRVLNILAAVALGFLLIDPEQMFEASFQLTFLAVGFIGAFATPLLERTSYPRARALADLPDTGRDLHLAPAAAQFRVEMRLLAQTLRLWTRLPERACCLAVGIPARVLFYAFQLAVVSAIVQIGLALPMVGYFHRIGFSGVSANTIVVPLMCAVIPVGFIAIFTGWAWVARAAGWLLAASHSAVDWHMRIEPGWRIPTPPLWLAIAIGVALVAAALVPIARRVWSIIVGVAVAVLVALLVWHPFAPQIALHKLEMTVVDVGQGDSILLTFPDGKLMLVDGGGIPTFGHHTPSQMDIGEDVVSPYLWDRSISHIDVMAATHAHADHIGGLPSLLANFHVKQLWTGANSDNPAWCALRDKALADGVRIVPLHRGQRFQYGGAQLEVLAPAVDYLPKDAPHNNDSLAFRLTFGRHSFLLCGDIERQIEAELVAEGLVHRTDVLKVAHHGSRTSSTPAFLDLALPTFAVISAGFENSYGHPHPDVIERIEDRHAGLLRTDLDGLITVRSDGRRLELEVARWSGALGSADGALLPRVF